MAVLPNQLTTLVEALAGEFENDAQAIAQPAWYVHLRLWHRPVPVFGADSFALFAEQANYLYPDKAYRQRLLRFQCTGQSAQLSTEQYTVQYYGFKSPSQVQGAGLHPEKLAAITADDLEDLQGCCLPLTISASDGMQHFQATQPPGTLCSFQYNNEARYVSLGFEATLKPNQDIEFLSYDKGVDPATNKALWGAIMGPYRFRKVQAYRLPT